MRVWLLACLLVYAFANVHGCLVCNAFGCGCVRRVISGGVCMCVCVVVDDVA